MTRHSSVITMKIPVWIIDTASSGVDFEHVITHYFLFTNIWRLPLKRYYKELFYLVINRLINFGNFHSDFNCLSGMITMLVGGSRRFRQISEKKVCYFNILFSINYKAKQSTELFFSFFLNFSLRQHLNCVLLTSLKFTMCTRLASKSLRCACLCPRAGIKD